MNTNFLSIINRIIAEQGEAILDDAARLKSLIKDYAAKEPKAERIAFEHCIDYGACDALKSISAPEERQAVKTALAQKIYEEEGIDRAFCIAAMDVLEAALLTKQSAPAALPYTPPQKTHLTQAQNNFNYTPVNNVDEAKPKDIVFIIVSFIGCALLLISLLSEFKGYGYYKSDDTFPLTLAITLFVFSCVNAYFVFNKHKKLFIAYLVSAVLFNPISAIEYAGWLRICIYIVTILLFGIGAYGVDKFIKKVKLFLQDGNK